MTFPQERRVELHRTNPVARLNGEIKPRTEILDISAHEAATVRLIGAIVME